VNFGAWTRGLYRRYKANYSDSAKDRTVPECSQATNQATSSSKSQDKSASHYIFRLDVP